MALWAHQGFIDVPPEWRIAGDVLAFVVLVFADLGIGRTRWGRP